MRRHQLWRRLPAAAVAALCLCAQGAFAGAAALAEGGALAATQTMPAASAPVAPCVASENTARASLAQTQSHQGANPVTRAPYARVAQAQSAAPTPFVLVIAGESENPADAGNAPAPPMGDRPASAGMVTDGQPGEGFPARNSEDRPPPADGQPITLLTLANQMPTDVALVASAAILLILTLLVVTVLHDVRHRQTRAHTAEIAAFLDYATKVNDDVWVLDTATLERWRYRIVQGEIRREPLPTLQDDLLRAYIHPEDMAEARDVLHRAIWEDAQDPHRQYHIDCRLRHGDQFKWSRVVLQRMLHTPERPSSIMVFVVDVDDTVRAEEQKNSRLTEALAATELLSKAKSAFTAYISHEIRSPLNAMLGYLALARNAVDDPARMSDLFVKSEYAANHLLQLVGDVLDMGTIESGSLHLAPARFDVREMIRTLAAIYNAQAKSRGIRYSVAVGELPAPCLLGDSLRIKQVAVNLLSNAMKFTPHGGAVTLTAEQTLLADGAARLTLCVTDTGIGMTEAFQQRLFTAYQQQDTATGGQFGGTGLGLSIARQLVTLMGGQISVVSRTGAGSTFTVVLELPVAAGACHLETAQPGTPARFAGKRLLVVEDNDMNLEIAVELLMQQAGLRLTRPPMGGRRWSGSPRARRAPMTRF